MVDTGREPSTPGWSAALSALADRILGPEHRTIVFREQAGPERFFEYRAECGELTVTASDAIAAAVGLHAYLREVCAVTVDWDAHLPLPVAEFSDAPTTRRTAEVDRAYYLNFCTTGYTSPYWGWDEWEREVDWMALHGITTPLTAVGHEAVLRDAYAKLGLSDEQARAFIGGPGYLPWHYMGNLDNFAGPLPASWADSHLELGRRILNRQRELGMTPVLPGFTGHVPPEIARERPGERTRTRSWQKLLTHVLDPADPLYAEIGAQITRSQIELLGTDHLYAIDPFIEMVPVDADISFPGAVADATLEGLVRADPEAVWVLQSWPFSYQRSFWSDERVAAFLDAIPAERLLLLDLFGEREPQWSRFDSFGDKSWIWCALLNFGGRTDPMANLQRTLDGINAAKGARNRPAGIGLAMEATRNNPAFFDLVIDQVWQRTEDVAPDWLPGFVRRRYGRGHDPALLEGWRGLLATIHSVPGDLRHPADEYGVLGHRPHYQDLADPEDLRARVSARVWYDWPDLIAAWEQLVGAAERSPEPVEGALGTDLADVAMAVVLRVFDQRYLNLVERVGAGGPRSGAGPRPGEGTDRTEGPGSREELNGLLAVVDDLDSLLATRPEYHYQRWEDQALAWARTPEERRVLIDNARRILTVWTTVGDGELDDYASRLWAGLVGDYYRSRWELWGQGLERAATDRAGASDELERALAEREEAFLANGVPRPPRADGDVVTRSRALLDRYGRTEHP
ncbi:alpha-N-acetylglucosaminidase [Nocardiopsis metallicus]|uniref:Alpha-N-acetylglucosaminidase n=1 Tax=Nocardiopsis metallicus TaxID=179819 RepID=A0A840W1Y7_9ACTN|nr:alpha-N-acetylglucosaminidase [Nocardiopsis metallicus]MBB5489994.1 alpha-N-acetylglucosaminidase [Nocardiopsis metallicus]